MEVGISWDRAIPTHKKICHVRTVSEPFLILRSTGIRVTKTLRSSSLGKVSRLLNLLTTCLGYWLPFPNVTQNSYFLRDAIATATNTKELDRITAVFISEVWSLIPAPLENSYVIHG